jgi:hypothetical protein
VEKARPRSLQPAAGGKLRKQKNRKRRAAAPRRNHHEAEKKHVADEHGEQHLRERHRQVVLLNPPIGGNAEDEIDARGGGERVRRRDVEHVGLEQQRHR